MALSGSSAREAARGALTRVRSAANYATAALSNAASAAGAAAASHANRAAEARASYAAEAVRCCRLALLDAPGAERPARVLLLGYDNGFAAWDADRSLARELCSRRDGAPVADLCAVPPPLQSATSAHTLDEARPLLALAEEGTQASVAGELAPVEGGGRPHRVRVYSLRTHEYVHSMALRSQPLAIVASARVLAVATAGHVHVYDAVTMELAFTTTAFSAPEPLLPAPAPAPLALGSRWLAYASAQPSSAYGPTSEAAGLSSAAPTGVAGGGFEAGGAPEVAAGGTAAVAAHYAKRGARQVVAGAAAGIRMLSSAYGASAHAQAAAAAAAAQQPQQHEHGGGGGDAGRTTPGVGEAAGAVAVRDVVSREVIACFRAHESPLATLAFSPSGLLLATASVKGHNINVFALRPATGALSALDSVPQGACSHLYKLHRGVTDAHVASLAFDSRGMWLAACTARGTAHLFAMRPEGGPVGAETHAAPEQIGSDACRSASLRLSGPRDAATVLGATPPVQSILAVGRVRPVSSALSGAAGVAATALAAAAAATRTQGALNVAAVTFCPSTADSLTLLVATPCVGSCGNGAATAPTANGSAIAAAAGGLARHQLVPRAGAPPPTIADAVGAGIGLAPAPARTDASAPPMLQLEASVLSRSEVRRCANWPEREAAVSFPQVQCDDSQWLSQAEVSRDARGVRLWQQPGVQFLVMTGRAAGSEHDVACFDNIESGHTRLVETRANVVTQIKGASADAAGTFYASAPPHCMMLDDERDSNDDDNDQKMGDAEGGVLDGCEERYGASPAESVTTRLPMAMSAPAQPMDVAEQHASVAVHLGDGLAPGPSFSAPTQSERELPFFGFETHADMRERLDARCGADEDNGSAGRERGGSTGEGASDRTGTDEGWSIDDALIDLD